MPSLIPGYEYDIFISYRQKDNKYDGWVTEFVENLKKELEATFKEEISVYFDINPHDGLLETHDVDESLKDKLKCLVFIPIISRTYCDPKAFAWENEFKTFVETASKDQFGLKVKLPGGNVANRVLPVQIHDLDIEDKKLVENELGGHLRGIEFIYKEHGVNRPLRANEDHPQDNLNKTYYRDQVNKVANAVKEIITALKKLNQHPEEVVKEDFEVKSVPRKNHKTTIIAGLVIALVLIILGFLFIPKLFKPEEEIEKSIAVMPFKNDSPDQERMYFINGTMEAVLDNLCKIKDLRVPGRTSVEQYRDNPKPVRTIAGELNVNYILEGSGHRDGDNVRLHVQLLDARKDQHLWSKTYDANIEDIFSMQSEIAQLVAAEIKAIITPEEKQIIERVPTYDLTAWDYYQRGREESKNNRGKLRSVGYVSDNKNRTALERAEDLYRKALEYDSTFAQAYTGLAWVYYEKQYWEAFLSESYLDSVLILADIALSYDNQLSEAYSIKGQYYRQIGNPEQALREFEEAIKFNPNDWIAYYHEGSLYWRVFEDFKKSIEYFHEAVIRNHGENLLDLLYPLGRAYLDIGFMDKAKYYFRQELALNGDSGTYFGRLTWLEFCIENFNKSVEYLNKAIKMDSTYFIFSPIYTYAGKHKEAYDYYSKMVDYYKRTGTLTLQSSHRIGYAYWKVGKYEEAENYFNEQINYGTESIKLGRDIASRKAAHYDLAGVYAFLGDKEKAYQYLDEFDKKDRYALWWLAFAKHDPLFASISGEERFQKILRNIEAKYRAEHERVRKWLEEQGML
jgi:TolB-like protein